MSLILTITALQKNNSRIKKQCHGFIWDLPNHMKPFLRYRAFRKEKADFMDFIRGWQETRRGRPPLRQVFPQGPEKSFYCFVNESSIFCSRLRTGPVAFSLQ
jgi:hypothetical protein